MFSNYTSVHSQITLRNVFFFPNCWSLVSGGQKGTSLLIVVDYRGFLFSWWAISLNKPLYLRMVSREDVENGFTCGSKCTYMEYEHHVLSCLSLYYWSTENFVIYLYFWLLLQLPYGQGLSLADVFGHLERNRWIRRTFFVRLRSFLPNLTSVYNLSPFQI